MPEPQFWLDRWTRNEIGFHEGAPNAHLVQFAGALGAPGRVLVPFCGKTEDLAWLAAAGWEVTGVEISERAVRAFFDERGLIPAVQDGPPGFRVYTAAGVSTWLGDFYALADTGVPRFDALYDRAALIATGPDERTRYAEVASSLVRPGGAMLLVTLEHDAPGGPPFSVPASEVASLYGSTFTLEHLDRQEAWAQFSRLQARGATRADVVATRLTRVG